MMLLIAWLCISLILTFIALYGIETNRTPVSALITFALCATWPLILLGAVIAVICEPKKIGRKPMQ